VSYGSREWANGVLVHAIREIYGRGASQVQFSRLQIIFHYRDELRAKGFWWQVKILNFHLHRAQRKGLMVLHAPKARDSRGDEREEVLS
jgi:hypothetical protein